MTSRAILCEGARNYLHIFRSFVAQTPSSDTFYSLFVTLKPDVLDPLLKSKFCIYASRRRVGTMDENVCSDNEEKSTRYNATLIGVLPMIRAMVACRTWTHGKFVFEHESPIEPCFVPFLDSLMFEMLSLLRFHPSLSYLDIQFNRLSQVHARPLISSDLSIEALILTPGALEVPYHAESIAEYLSRNSVLKSCTLGLESCDFQLHPQFLEIILRPFTTSVPGKANAVLKELVLRIASCKVPPGLWEECVSKLVRCNSSLRSLELLFILDGSNTTSARKVWFNRELQEFGMVCSTAELSLLKDRVSIFDQAKPSLTTLKLCPASPFLGKDFIRSLGHYLNDCSSFVKDVHVSSGMMGQPWTTWEHSCDDARDVEFGTQDMLKSMVSKELILNTTLQSLVVGHWTLLRVGTEWQTSYGGPCLLSNQLVQGENPLLTQHRLWFLWRTSVFCRDVEEHLQ